MPTQTTQITDTELLTALNGSLIDETQKTELTQLIPSMTAEERIQLMGLIQQANEEIGKARAEQNAEIRHIDQKYMRKTINKLEEIDNEKNTSEFKLMEAQIEKNSAQTGNSASQPTTGKSRHTVRNLVITLLILTTLATGILYALAQL